MRKRLRAARGIVPARRPVHNAIQVGLGPWGEMRLLWPGRLQVHPDLQPVLHRADGFCTHARVER
eukprot:4144457-Pyramimonas_sp.AAC.1